MACSGIAQAAIGFRPAYANVPRIYAHPRNMGAEVGAGNPRWNWTHALDLGFKRIVRSLAKKILGGYYLSAIVGTRAPCRGPGVNAPKGESDKGPLDV